MLIDLNLSSPVAVPVDAGRGQQPPAARRLQEARTRRATAANSLQAPAPQPPGPKDAHIAGKVGRRRHTLYDTIVKSK